MRRALLLIALVAVSVLGSAQMTLIPRSRLDSVANPRVVASPMVVEGGTTVDLGVVEESATGRAQVVVVNRGKQPMVITRISTTCRCLAVQSDRRVIGAAERATLTLTYYPKGHPGAIVQRAMIYTDRSDELPTAVIDVRGTVRPMADRRGDYRHSCGALLLRRRSVAFGSTRTERIACMNGGTTPLHIVKDTLLSSRSVMVECRPEVLQPMQEGDLVVTLCDGADESDVRLFIEGVVAPPSQREIRITKETK